MRKRVLAGLLTTAVVAGMFGMAVSAEDKTLEVFYWDDLQTSSDLTTQQFKAAVDRFNEADNGYQIKVSTSDLTNYYTKLNALVAADNLPDVFMCHPGNLMRNAAQAGVLMPLDDLLKEDGWYDTFNAGYFDSLKYEDQIVGLPIEGAGACVFYNKDIFAAAGVEELPSNWEEFKDVCQKLKDAGYTPIVESGAEDWVIGVLGGYLADRNGGSADAIVNGTINWTDQSFVDAGNCLLELVDNGYFQDLDTTEYALPDHYIVTGHSRGGKVSLYEGIYEKRAAMCHSNDSGCGGAGSIEFLGSRYGRGIGRCETLENVSQGMPYWWGKQVDTFVEQWNTFPLDSHILRG